MASSLESARPGRAFFDAQNCSIRQSARMSLSSFCLSQEPRRGVPPPAGFHAARSCGPCMFLFRVSRRRLPARGRVGRLL